ncbi:MAG TPA: YgiQ family radical SAM protein [Candidatus Nanoarchaeia archaeon]|nr:YgiQ family radical SAM protein [Candidatus Nanoarchaeia archaeon]
MISTRQQEEQYDIILLTAECYEDHPLSPAGVIARVLDAKGFKVGIIEKPLSKEDFSRLGAPRLCFCVTSGSIDSMVNNYTPLKKKRFEDAHSNALKMPDRAVIVYCNRLKELFKQSRIVIGGIEASLRRFAHYDYWDNDVRKSILLDSRADILVYGNGEKQIIQIAEHLRAGKPLIDIEGTCVLSKTLPESFMLLPSFKEIKADRMKFCRMQAQFSNWKDLAQGYDNNYVLQYRYPRYTPEDLDWIYSLPYTRRLNKNSLLSMARFSIVTHRGCIGRCNFCSITLHQGDKIISRTEKSIISEIERLTKHPDFKGVIDDLGGPSANMYGMDCATPCLNDCLSCLKLNKSHSRIISLLRKAREIKGIKKIFIRSGIRYDLALNSKEYIKEISEHHISGCLKIAPEHFSERVLRLMNKDEKGFEEFRKVFERLNRDRKQELKYYLMIGHPGDSPEEIALMVRKMRGMKNVEQFQMFTPTPMSDSTCMYWTGLDPFTLKEVPVIRDYRTKKLMKREMLRAIEGKL